MDKVAILRNLVLVANSLDEKDKQVEAGALDRMMRRIAHYPVGYSLGDCPEHGTRASACFWCPRCFEDVVEHQGLDKENSCCVHALFSWDADGSETCDKCFAKLRE